MPACLYLLGPDSRELNGRSVNVGDSLSGTSNRLLKNSLSLRERAGVRVFIFHLAFVF